MFRLCVVFLSACFGGHLEIVRFLLEKQCGIHATDNGGDNSFIYACDEGNLEIVKFLFENKCGIHEANNGFIHACDKGHLEIVKFLFEKKCGIPETFNDSFMISLANKKIKNILFLNESGNVPAGLSTRCTKSA